MKKIILIIFISFSYLFCIEASSIYKEYQRNEISGDLKYKNKTIQIRNSRLVAKH